MGNWICEELIKYRNGNNTSLEKIINTFNPLISKYSRLLDGEDTKQDLALYLIKVINKISIEKNNFLEDKAIFVYIAKSIRNEYIKLSQKADKKRVNETELNLDVEIGYEDFESEMELLDLFNVLTEKEAYVMKLIYVHYLSISEVADFMEVSRQSINQTKNRALKKLRETYLT